MNESPSPMSDARKNARAAFERRFKAKGNHNLTLRLSSAVMERLEALATNGLCSRRDIIESLILGQPLEDPRIALMRNEGMSLVEADAYLSIPATLQEITHVPIQARGNAAGAAGDRPGGKLRRAEEMARRLNPRHPRARPVRP